MALPPETIAFLLGIAFLAGTIDAMAGGGGLLTIPALMSTGMPPVAALATNKLQSAIGTASSFYTFWRGGHVEVKRFAWPVLGAFVGSALGALAVQIIDSSFLAAIVPILLVMMALYFLLAPSMSAADRTAKLGPLPITLIITAIGFYDGFFGPGTGSFMTLALVALGGFGLVRAIAGTKLLNLTTNIAALVMLALGGHMLWALGLTMAVANVAGAQLGTRLAIRFGGKGVRPLLVIMSLALTAKLLSDPENPLWTLLS